MGNPIQQTTNSLSTRHDWQKGPKGSGQSIVKQLRKYDTDNGFSSRITKKCGNDPQAIDNELSKHVTDIQKNAKVNKKNHGTDQQQAAANILAQNNLASALINSQNNEDSNNLTTSEATFEATFEENQREENQVSNFFPADGAASSSEETVGGMTAAPLAVITAAGLSLIEAPKDSKIFKIGEAFEGKLTKGEKETLGMAKEDKQELLTEGSKMAPRARMGAG